MLKKLLKLWKSKRSFGQFSKDDENYLNQSVDVFDLERRQRNLERSYQKNNLQKYY